MNRDLYWLGHEAGKAIAIDMKKSIVGANKSDLPGMAGQRIYDAVKHSEVPYVRTNSWQSGMFDGFMEKSEQLRGES